VRLQLRRTGEEERELAGELEIDLRDERAAAWTDLR
jgi:hypothetical protein